MRCLCLIVFSLLVLPTQAQPSPLTKMFLRLNLEMPEGEIIQAHQKREQDLAAYLQLQLLALDVALVEEEEAHWEMRVRAVPKQLVATDFLVLSAVLSQPLAAPEALQEEEEKEANKKHPIASGAWVKTYMQKELMKSYRVLQGQEVFVVPINDLQSAAAQIADYVDRRVLYSLRQLHGTQH